jgi:hypothetical protein
MQKQQPLNRLAWCGPSLVYLQVLLQQGMYLLEMELLQFLLPSTMQEFKPGQFQLSPVLL